VKISALIFIVFSTVFCLFSLSSPLESWADDNYISISKADCENAIDLSPKNKYSIHLNCKTYHQTTGYTCGPAAVMTLMRYYNRINDSEMNQKTELHMALEMGATDQGTTMSQMSDWLGTHGFNVDSGIRADSNMIINNLKKGVPTLLAVNHHWILAKGYTEGSTHDKDEILFSDSCCSTTIMYAGDIDSIWLEAQLNQAHNVNCNQNTSEYIVATPK
jgi:hypothetical protein